MYFLQYLFRHPLCSTVICLQHDHNYTRKEPLLQWSLHGGVPSINWAMTAYKLFFASLGITCRVQRRAVMTQVETECVYIMCGWSKRKIIWHRISSCLFHSTKLGILYIALKVKNNNLWPNAGLIFHNPSQVTDTITVVFWKHTNPNTFFSKRDALLFELSWTRRNGMRKLSFVRLHTSGRLEPNRSSARVSPDCIQSRQRSFISTVMDGPYRYEPGPLSITGHLNKSGCEIGNTVMNCQLNSDGNPAVTAHLIFYPFKESLLKSRHR